RVVEFNCRFGDPETQAVLSLLESPLGEVLDAAASGRLAEVGELQWSPDSAVIVVLAANGYPGTPDRGGNIAGPRLFAGDEAVHIVHAGTAGDEAGLTASGGRVLGVVGRGADLVAARAAAYGAIDALEAPTLFCRRDIGARAATGQIPTPVL
ncbi:MAG TPA: phosphoribosylamine--glycine ligase, partial [Propionibacterium sp.]|nr:phosphoribosylamine--glycine ligase [Propionibacterium sp.]